jgi:hypothetical protein
LPAGEMVLCFIFRGQAKILRVKWTFPEMEKIFRNTLFERRFVLELQNSITKKEQAGIE